MSSLVKFERRIRQSGGSVGITIPDELLKAAGIQKGDTVSLWMNEKRQIIVEKAT